MHNDKKVGLIIPIYNGSSYLKACLDSVLLQDYPYLEVVLVDDGSLETEVLTIAKEYIRSNKNWILFTKKNGGQGSAKNAGIEYFCQHFDFKEARIEGDLQSYEILGGYAHSLHCYKAYTAKGGLRDKSEIDYLIFLDSDDFWDKNLLKTYIHHMITYEPNVLWADFKNYYDGIEDLGLKTHFENYQITQEGMIDAQEWADINLKTGIRSFPFTWQGMINFRFFKDLHLRFLNQTTQEDLCFGVLLFSQCEKILLLQQKLYYYRIRKNSTSAYEGEISKENLPPYLQELYELCNKDASLTKSYSIIYNYYKISWELIKFIQETSNKNASNLVKKVFLPTYCKRAKMIFGFSIDPLNLKEQFYTLRPYLNQKTGALKRVKNQLSYKLGLKLMDYSNNLIGVKALVLEIALIIIFHRIRLVASKLSFMLNPKLKPPALEDYKDFKEAFALKNQEVYQLGSKFLQTRFTLGKLKHFLFELRK